jgi:hypothetical protein
MRLKEKGSRKKRINKKRNNLDIGPSYKQQLLKIVFIELNKIIHNTLKHLTRCSCVGKY